MGLATAPQMNTPSNQQLTACAHQNAGTGICVQEHQLASMMCHEPCSSKCAADVRFPHSLMCTLMAVQARPWHKQRRGANLNQQQLAAKISRLHPDRMLQWIQLRLLASLPRSLARQALRPPSMRPRACHTARILLHHQAATWQQHS